MSILGDKVYVEDNVDVVMNMVVLDKVKLDDVIVFVFELIDFIVVVLF